MKYEFKGTKGEWVSVVGEPYIFEGTSLQTCDVYTDKTRGECAEDGITHYEEDKDNVSNITICSIGTFQDDIQGEEAKANTYLCAAAPELLQACIDAWEHINVSYPAGQEAVSKVKAAIHKALNIPG